MKDIIKLYGEFAKAEEQDDGTIKVFGYASSEAVDGDGEIMSADAMKAALPDYMKFGAVREMHQASAAGTAIEARVEDDGKTWFGAHIVDPVAVKKVQTKVYKGFSIGGKIKGRDELNKSKITAIKLIEVSLVDRPSNPDAVFEMYKADDLDKAEVDADESKKAEDVAKAADAEKLPDVAGTDEEVLKFSALLNEKKMSMSDAITALIKYEPVKKEEELKKSMYTLSSFAQTLSCIADLCRSSQYEMEYEGDASPVPAQLREWLGKGVGIFKAMSTEEADELVAEIETTAGLYAGKCAESDDLQKAGARHSKEDAEHLQEAHNRLTKMGAACLKAHVPADEDDGEKVAKGAATDADLKKELTELKERLKKVESMPAATPRTSLRAIAKGQDTGLTEAPKGPQIEPIYKADGTIDMAASVIKYTHALGGTQRDYVEGPIINNE